VIPPAAPAPTLTATATTSTNVALSWSAVAGAVNYEIHRSVNGGPFTLLNSTTVTSLNDGTVSANTTYLYQVRAGSAGEFSNVDPATTVMFTDSPLIAGTPVKAVHFTQLRTAVNAMRAAAGLTAFSFTDAIASGVRVKAVHRNELRTALDAARAGIGLSALTYTAGTSVQALHVTELRDGVK
jgi:fibronectin type 3 domain-containing protein